MNIPSLLKIYLNNNFTARWWNIFDNYISSAIREDVRYCRKYVGSYQLFYSTIILYFVIYRPTSHLLDDLQFEVRWWQPSISTSSLLHSIIPDPDHHHLYNMRFKQINGVTTSLLSTFHSQLFLNLFPFNSSFYLPLFWDFRLDTASIVTVFIASAEAFGI